MENEQMDRLDFVPELDEVVKLLDAVSATTSEVRGDTRDRILEAAIELFASHGYEAASLRLIAEAVGIKTPGLYSHFSSKEEILSAAITRSMSHFMSTVLAGSDDRSAYTRLRTVIRRHVTYYLTGDGSVTAFDKLISNDLLRSTLPAAHYQLVLRGRMMYLAHLETLILKSRPDAGFGTRPITMSALLSLLNGVGDWYRDWAALDADHIADQYWHLASSMLEVSDSPER